MRAHLVQMDIAWEDKEANYLKVGVLLSGADVAPGDLIVLPEMFDTGFSLNPDRTADAVEGGTTIEFLRGLAKRLGAVVQGARTIAAPPPPHGDGKGRNMATIIGAGGEVLAEYAKVHPFSYGREPERFTGGDKVVTYTWTRVDDRPVNVCPAVCYDLRFPELFRLGLLAGAEVIAIGANWPAARAGHWRTLLVARAIENQAVVLGVNRTGADPNLEYGGGTIAVGARGEVLGELGEHESVLSVEVDIGAVREWRKTFPAWRDVKLIQGAIMRVLREMPVGGVSGWWQRGRPLPWS
jgi:omega-amidase